uniref:Uncharacterized protein n=1 Tax=Cacopsylla melanoneura TaxID=428564 RepID=A0A8D8M0Q4_9HEMI
MVVWSIQLSLNPNPTDMPGTTTVIDKKSKLHPPPTPEIESAMKTENTTEKKMKVHTPFTPNQLKASPWEKMEVDIPPEQLVNEKNQHGPGVKLTNTQEEKVINVPELPKTDTTPPPSQPLQTPETSKSLPKAQKSPTVEGTSNLESLTSTPSKNQGINLKNESIQEQTSKKENILTETQKTFTSEDNSNVHVTTPATLQANLVEPPTPNRQPPAHNKKSDIPPSPEIKPKPIETKAPAPKPVEPSPSNKTDSAQAHPETKVETQPNISLSQNKPSSPVPKPTEDITCPSSDKVHTNLITPKTLKSSSPTRLPPANNEKPTTTVPQIKTGIDNLLSKSVQSPVTQENTATTANTQRKYEKLTETTTAKVLTIPSNEKSTTSENPVTTPIVENSQKIEGQVSPLVSDRKVSTTTKETTEDLKESSTKTVPSPDKVQVIGEKKEIPPKPHLKITVLANKENVTPSTSPTAKSAEEILTKKSSTVTTPGADKITTPKLGVTEKVDKLIKSTGESHTQTTLPVKPKEDNLSKSSTNIATTSLHDSENKNVTTIRKPKLEKMSAVNTSNITVTENIAKLKIEDKNKEQTETLEPKISKETRPTSPSKNSTQVSQSKGITTSKLTTSENKLSSSSISSVDSSSSSSPSRVPNSNPLNIPIISSGRTFQRGMSKSSSPDTRTAIESQLSTATNIPSKTQSAAQSINVQNDEIIQKISELTRTATSNAIAPTEAATSLRTIRVKRLESESTEVTSEKTRTIKSDGKKSEESIKASTTSKEIKSTSTVNKTNSTKSEDKSESKGKTTMSSANKTIDVAGTSSSASLTLKVPKIITHEICVETDEGERILSPEASKASAGVNIPRLKVMDDFRQDRRCSDISCFFPGENEFISEEISRLSDRLKDLKSCSFDNGSDADSLLNRIRRPKYRISNHSRDVPVNSPPPSSNMAYYMRSSQSPRSQSPTDDVLIKFLTQFNDKVDSKTKPKTLDVNKKYAPATAAVSASLSPRVIRFEDRPRRGVRLGRHICLFRTLFFLTGVCFLVCHVSATNERLKELLSG